MIGKIMIGKSFSGCLLYCLNDKVQKQQKGEEMFKNRTEILMFNKCYGNQKELIQQFNEVRQLNPKLSKPVAHITLSFAKGEQLDNNKLCLISESCAKELGFENNQYVAVLHKDTQHQHLHIVANRIGFNARTISDSNNYQKIANFCRKIELRYGLQQVLNPKKFLSNEERNLPRNDKRKKQLGLVIRNTVHNAKDFDHFVRIMQAKGYTIIKGRGISFIDDKKVKIKGSEVGYSLQKIESNIQTLNRLSTDQEFFKQVNKRNPLKDATEAINHVPIKDENISVTRHFKQDVSETFDALLKPEQMPEQDKSKVASEKKEKEKITFVIMLLKVY